MNQNTESVNSEQEECEFRTKECILDMQYYCLMVEEVNLILLSQ